MKKILLPILLATLILITGCGNKAAEADTAPVQKVEGGAASEERSSAPADFPTQIQKNDSDVFEIKEKMFIAQCNDIYLNPDEYMNRTIKVEGMYNEYEDPSTGKARCYVYRNGPGCCGNDGVAGFEILYEGDAPKPKDWIAVEGKIEVIGESGSEYVALRLSSLKVLDVRGAEYVEN